MPTRLDTNFPRLKSDAEFENLILDLCRLEWADPFASDRHGRSGQGQEGVDIYGHPADCEGEVYGTQCKLRTGNRLPTEGEIEREVERARNFTPSLQMLIIATDAPRDVETQKIVRVISERERANGGFGVTIWFWDSICHRLAAYNRLIVKYFHDLFPNLTTAPEAERLVDVPLQILSIGGQPGTGRTSLEENLVIRGIQIKHKVNFSGLGESMPDGILCQIPVGSENLLHQFAGCIFAKLELNAPLFIVLPLGLQTKVIQIVNEMGRSLETAIFLDANLPENRLAQYIFERVFKHGYRRRGSLATIDISIRSNPTRPLNTFLEINWESLLSLNRFPTPDEWNHRLLPALEDVKQLVSSCGDSCLVQIRPVLQLPASFAWGYTFNVRIAQLGVWAREIGISDFRRQYWRSDAKVEPVTISTNWILPTGVRSQSMVIELSNGRDIHLPVQAFVSRSNINPDAWLQLGHQSTDPRLSNLDETCAVAFANRVGEVIRDVQRQGITDFHLFLCMPSSLAVLVGQRLQSCGRIHLYWYDNPSYQHAFTLK